MRLPWRRERDAERRLASADAGTRRSFVAALWAARGWETRIEGERVIARGHPTWGDETLLVPDGRPPSRVPDGVDAVVADGPLDAAVRTVTPAELGRLATYGVERSTGERLARRHLDAPLLADESPSRSGRRVDAALLGFVALVVLSAVVGAAGAPGGSSAASTDAAASASTPETPEEAPATASGDDRIAVGNLVAPGVSNEGVVDVEALEAAHTRAVADRSYVWFVTYREYRDGSRSSWPATRTERVVVENATNYRSDAGGGGEIVGTPYVVHDVDAYADGAYRYVREREGNRTTYERVPVYGRTLSGGEQATARLYAERAGRYVRWFLSGPETDVHDVVTVDDRTYYRVVALGSDYPGAENFSAVALVAPNGFVAEIRASYEIPDTERSVEVTLSYLVEDATVERPEWYEDARNATRPVLGDADDIGRDPDAASPSIQYFGYDRPPRPPRGNATGIGVTATGDGDAS